MSLNPVAAIVARRLKREGFSDEQVAGVLGNFQQESGLNPRINEGGKVGAPLGKGGYGLGQWTADRQFNLINFAKQRKMDPGDPTLQADFLVHELSGPEKRAAETLRQAKSPEQAALVFRRDYERAGIPKDEVRMQAARNFLPKISSLESIDQPTAPQNSQGTTAASLLNAFKMGLMGQALFPMGSSELLSAIENPRVPVDIGQYDLAPRSPYLDALTSGFLK